MKKHIGIVTVAAVLCMVVGCGKKDEITVSELASVLSENAVFAERLTQIDTANTEKRYAINSKDYKEITAYVGTAGVCDEFVIAKTNAPEEMKTKFEKYLKDKRGSYEKYRPGEVYKLDNAIIEVYADAAVLIVTADTEKAHEVYCDYLKK